MLDLSSLLICPSVPIAPDIALEQPRYQSDRIEGRNLDDAYTTNPPKTASKVLGMMGLPVSSLIGEMVVAQRGDATLMKSASVATCRPTQILRE